MGALLRRRTDGSTRQTSGIGDLAKANDPPKWSTSTDEFYVERCFTRSILAPLPVASRPSSPALRPVAIPAQRMKVRVEEKSAKKFSAWRRKVRFDSRNSAQDALIRFVCTDAIGHPIVGDKILRPQ